MRFISAVLIGLGISVFANAQLVNRQVTEIRFFELHAMKSIDVLTSTYLGAQNEVVRIERPDSIVFPAGTSFALISESKDGNQRAIFRLGVERPLQSPADLPVEITVLASEVVAPEFTHLLLDTTLPADAVPQAEYYNTNNIEGLNVQIPRFRIAAVCPRNGKPTPGMTYCFCYVKLKLIELKFTDVYLPGGTAAEAAGLLPSYGFAKVSRNQHNAKIYDVCTYVGGNPACPGGCGHIEILLKEKGKRGWYYGPYGEVYHSEPISDRLGGRPFNGCYRKTGI